MTRRQHIYLQVALGIACGGSALACHITGNGVWLFLGLAFLLYGGGLSATTPPLRGK